jgi:hypothetical protein
MMKRAVEHADEFHDCASRSHLSEGLKRAERAEMRALRRLVLELEAMYSQDLRRRSNYG